MQRFWSWIDEMLLWVSGIAAIACAVHVTLDVVMKYLFLSPIPGTINIVSNYYMIILVFLPLAVAEARNAHISVDIVPLATGRVGEIWTRTVYLFSCSVFAALAYNTAVDAWSNYEVKSFALDQGGLIYIWPSYFILPAGFALISALTLCKSISPNLVKSHEEIVESHG